jgi:hypothetical protein
VAGQPFRSAPPFSSAFRRFSCGRYWFDSTESPANRVRRSLPGTSFGTHSVAIPPLPGGIRRDTPADALAHSTGSRGARATCREEAPLSSKRCLGTRHLIGSSEARRRSTALPISRRPGRRSRRAAASSGARPFGEPMSANALAAAQRIRRFESASALTKCGTADSACVNARPSTA